ncbi:MAG: hypothetical protein HFJ37_03130 [Clostridia bacterium]|nr:hypothetical protein [Clostridia bacterium]
MKNKGNKIKETLKQHIINNRKEYIIVTLLFIIGIFLGVLFVNNIQEAPRVEIESYLQNFIEKMKTIQNLEHMSLLKTSIGQNIGLAIIIWFFGTTVIRDPHCFWTCGLSRLLFRVYYISLYFDYGNVKRIILLINKCHIPKFDFHTSYFSFSSKWI